MDDTEQTPGPRRRSRVRIPAVVGAGIVLVAGVGTAGALGLGGGGTDDAGRADPRTSRTVRVEQGTLTEQREIDGTLGHGAEVPFRIRAEGTVTWLPEAGAKVGRGGTVLRVDDRPVALLYGSLPMYRELALRQPDLPATGSDDSTSGGTEKGEPRASPEPQPSSAPQSPSTPRPLYGMDVRQFETNLSALGYTGFTVDDEYTGLTAEAVERWQRDLGLPQTGRVAVGDVLYAPGPVRIANTGIRIGADATGDPVTYTSTSRMVTMEAPAADLEWAERGTAVTVELPDGRTVKGEVAQVGRDATAPDAPGSGQDEGPDAGGPAAGGAVVSVVVAFDDQKAVGRLESGPVTVRYVLRRHKDVLTVPVAALVALAEGGYALEPADGTGAFVPVGTGLFADGLVEVSGSGIRAGTKVRIPE
ncbi:peptidoglycan-binding protein [Streptomyces sp. NBC_00464]|uniref:peptidoglycan-binding domain-containing protein n=1 Tax=Streptomyces sp. NBC_00464 TaxID=2975751 RepID=UPI002E18B137